jgi:Phage Mu protein F like protein
MTQPTPDPYAAQRAAAVEVYTQYESALYDAYLTMMADWLGKVQASVLNAGITSLALMPDPFAVFAATPLYAELSAKYTAAAVREVLAPVYASVLGPDVIFETRPFVQDFIAKMTNNLQGMPDEVFALVGDVIHHATVNGASIPDVQEQLAQLFTVTDNAKWAHKAKTVAITTMHTAYAGGLHDAFSALVEDDPDTEWVHRWLATEDTHTRPWHREADGQAQPWGVPFSVGPDQLMFPGDPAGSPANTVNCRCVELLEVKGEPTPMENKWTPGSLAAAAAQMRAFAAGDLHAYCSLTACKATGKPGLCKGQHRGDVEPGTDIPQGADANIAAQAQANAKQLDDIAARLRTMMSQMTPEQRARASSALATYQRQSSQNKTTVANEGRLQAQHDSAVAQARAQAKKDAAEQDKLDAAAKKKAAGNKSKIKNVAAGLKSYQTSTKV